MKFVIQKIKIIGICCSIVFAILIVTGCTQVDELKNMLKQQLVYDIEPKEVPSISQGLYVYEQLSSETKIVYDQIVQLLLEQKESAVVASDDTDIVKEAFHAVLTDHPEIFWTDSYSINCHYVDEQLEYCEMIPTYTMTKEERTQYQMKIDDYTAKCIAGIKDTDDEYSKAKYIYEYIIKNTEYNEDAVHNQNICSVMAHHSSVCMGYARTMQYLLKEADILSVTVSGYTEEGSHAWNLIRIDDEFYYVDVTWGDMQFKGEYSLDIEVDYSYFCVTTEELLKTHTPDEQFKLYECTSVAHNYYRMEGLYLEQVHADVVQQMIRNNPLANVFSVKCANTETYQQLIEYLLIDEHIYDYIERNSVNYLEKPELNILTIQIQ